MDKGQLIKVIVAGVILIAAAVFILKYVMGGGGDTGGRSDTQVGAIEAPVSLLA